MNDERTAKNPTLTNVNVHDPEDCEACADAADWPCAYHAGFVDGFDFMSGIMRLAVDDPESVRGWQSARPRF